MDRLEFIDKWVWRSLDILEIEDADGQPVVGYESVFQLINKVLDDYEADREAPGGAKARIR